MDNAGDWLYIVLIAIAGISSIYSSFKKKKEENAQNEQPRPEKETESEPAPAKDFWDFLQDELEKEKTPAPPPTPARKPVERYNPQPFKTGPKISSPKAQSELLVEEEETPLIQGDVFNDPDELRKAVIYTEILNRKY